jgi:hypothetical protein
MKFLRAGLAALSMVGSAACARGVQTGSPPATAQQTASPAPAASTCTAPPAASTANVGPSTLVGRFTVEMVATSGAKSGSRATGSLKLDPVDSSGSIVVLSETPRELVAGAMGVEIGAVGAMAPGATLPNGERPVKVIQWRAGPGDIRVVMRVGASKAPPPGTMAIEGTYLSLMVQSVSASRVAGTWTSGSGMTESGGYFCADR